MKVKVKEFIKVLSAVKPGLANKEILEQSTNFIFLNRNIVTYNDEIMISHPFQFEFSGAINAENIFTLLSKIKEDEIEVEQTDKELKFSGINTKFKSGVVCDTEIKLPISEINIPDKWKKLPEGFLDAIKYTSTSVSNDASRPQLTCLHFTSNSVESCDNYRITKYTLKGFPYESLNIPFRLIADIHKYKPTHIAVGDGWIHFKNADGVIYSCRDFSGEFPDLSGFLEVEGTEIYFPKDILESIDRAKVLATEELTKDRLIEIALSKNELTIKSQSEYGWYNESFRIRYSGVEVVFKVSAGILAEILGHFKNAILAEDLSRLKFETENFIHIVSLQ